MNIFDRALDSGDFSLIQLGLIATGDYQGTTRGIPGEKSRAAYEAYRRRIDGRVPPPSNKVPLADLIIRTASRFVGLKEVRPNEEWDNPSTPGRDSALSDELIELMRPAPWQPGWAYCAAFAEGCVSEALRLYDAPVPVQIAFARVMGPHVVTAARAFDRIGLLKPNPVRGAIWFARKGTSSSGHAGIVEMVNGGAMGNIEANTGAGSEAEKSVNREGDWIDRKHRNVRQNGQFSTLGFVHPEDILQMR